VIAHVGGDACSSVAYLQLDVGAGSRQADSDRAVAADGLERVLDDVEQRLLHLDRIEGDWRQAVFDLETQRDPAALRVRADEGGDGTGERLDCGGFASRCGQADDIGEGVREPAQAAAPCDRDLERGGELAAIFAAHLVAVREASGEQRADGGGGVVDLVRHHTDELLVGCLLGSAQLVGQLFQDQERAVETAVEEVAALTLDTAAAEERQHARFAVGEPGERGCESAVELDEAAALERWGRSGVRGVYGGCVRLG